MTGMDRAKPFCIAKRDVWEAYKQVKANRGAAGVDGQSIEDFDRDLRRNLYRIWNRMCSGSYFPPPVRRVDIPKGVWRNSAAWYSNGCRQNCPDGRQAIPGADPGTRVPRGFLRIPFREIGTRCTGRGPTAMLGSRLGA